MRVNHMNLNKDKRFDIDLQYGVIFEQQLLDMFQNSKVEVKSERNIWTKTQNIVIEYESRGKPSGIAPTESEYWFHNLVKDDVLKCSICFPVAQLKEYIKKTNPRSVSGGDNMTSKLYLINLQDLFKNIGD